MKKLFLFALCFALLLTNCKHKGGAVENITHGEQAEPNCSLLSIELKQSGSSIASFSHVISEKLEASLNAMLSENAKLECFVSTISKTAKVYFDSETESKEQHQYTSLNENKIIKITCKDGEKEKNYQVELKEPFFNSPLPNDTVKVSLVGFVGGIRITGAKVECFNASDGSLACQAKTTDSNGEVFFGIEKGKRYNFVASKKGRASSRLSNVSVENKEGMANIVMILHDGAVGFKHIAPEVSQIKLGKKDDEVENMSDVADGALLNLNSLMQDEKGFFVETKSLSGKCIPNRQEEHEKNFGLVIGIGKGYSSLEDFPISLRPIAIPFSDGKEFKNESGIIVQRYFLPLKKIEAIDGKYTLYVVAYDLAGNRVEKRVLLNIVGNITEKANTKDSITKFEAEMRRFSKPLNTFSLPSENGIETACNVLFSFDVSSRYISAVEVYRKEKDENINDGWKKVSARVYTDKFEGIPIVIDEKKGRVFKAVDDSNELEEGKTYQYKLKVFKKATFSDMSDEGFFFSPIATLSVLPSFDVKLLSPRHYEKIKFEDLNSTSFSFRISNTNVLKKENADYFAFGLLVLDSETWNSGNTQKEGVVYATKLRYYLGDGEKLEVFDGSSNKWRLYSKFNAAKSFKVRDLLEFKEDGSVIIKQKFLRLGDFNLVGGRSFHKCLSKGNLYYWDIQDFGKDYVSISDDVAPFFIKECSLKDSVTGDDIQGKAFSYSMSNSTYEDNAINGRFAFTVEK